jgi:hypothetical protein
MTPFTCGCSADGTTRCAGHTYQACHRPVDGIIGTRWTAGECPPCHLARLRSVSLDSRATPTRGGGK